jgi:plastocyanin
MSMPNEPRPHRTRLALVLAVVLALTALAACSSSSKSSGSTTADITVKDFTFSTTPVTAGATVTVHNDGPSTHTVTADAAGGFNVTIDPGKDATFTAPSAPGDYKFHCNIHSQMHGTLTVQ